MKNLTDGQLLRIARKIYGIKLAEMGEVLYCNMSQISSMERGTRRIHPLRKEKIGALLRAAEEWYFSVVEAIKNYAAEKGLKAEKMITYLDRSLSILTEREQTIGKTFLEVVKK